MITRAEISGALKMLNATETPDRKRNLKSMLSVEHNAKDVAKVLSDLDSYPEWAARMDLEVAAPVAATAPAVPLKKNKK